MDQACRHCTSLSTSSLRCRRFHTLHSPHSKGCQCKQCSSAGHGASVRSRQAGRAAHSLGLGLIAHISIFLSHTHHHALMAWATHDGREYSSGSIISSKARLDHSRAIVAHKSGDLAVLSHVADWQAAQRCHSVAANDDDMQVSSFLFFSFVFQQVSGLALLL